MAQRYQVVIVGGGPVGVGLAVDLGLRGVSCIVVEKRTALSSIPKGQGLSQRTLEHCWSWGVADDIRDTYNEAKSQGYDAKIMRQIVRLRKMEPHDRQEMEAILDTYKAALGLG